MSCLVFFYSPYETLWLGTTCMATAGQISVRKLMQRLMGGSRHGSNGSSTGEGLNPLVERLSDHKVTRLALSFLEANDGRHLKDIGLEDMTDDRRATYGGQSFWNFGSDSFLGLDRDPRVHAAIQDALPEWGSHNGASRAFSSPRLTDEAEAKLAQWLGVTDTFIFPSVTLTNIGVLPAIAGKGDVLVVDRESHDSVHQGARLAAAGGARLEEVITPTAKCVSDLLQRIDAKAAVMAIDGVYSMSGKSPHLVDLDATVRGHGGILYVDDAHGTGVVGPQGRGAAYQALGSLSNILMVGSLSKAFSCLGGFVTCTPDLKTILKIRSSTFIFGGPVPPPYLAAICAVCDIFMSPEYEMILKSLRERIQRVRLGLDALGLAYHCGDAAIVSVVVGDIEKTFDAGKKLFERGFYVQSATYPAVPINGGLLRIQVNANHSYDAIDGLLNALDDVTRELRISRQSKPDSVTSLT